MQWLDWRDEGPHITITSCQHTCYVCTEAAIIDRASPPPGCLGQENLQLTLRLTCLTWQSRPEWTGFPTEIQLWASNHATPFRMITNTDQPTKLPKVIRTRKMESYCMAPRTAQQLCQQDQIFIATHKSGKVAKGHTLLILPKKKINEAWPYGNTTWQGFGGHLLSTAHVFHLVFFSHLLQLLKHYSLASKLLVWPAAQTQHTDKWAKLRVHFFVRQTGLSNWS